MNTVNCPLCDGEIDAKKLIEIEDNLTVNESIISESNKIKFKLKDLQDTIKSNYEELYTEESKLKKLNFLIEDVDKLLDEKNTPELDSIKTKIQNLSAIFSDSSKLEIYGKELSYYINEKASLEAKLKIKPSTPSSIKIDNDSIKPLLNHIQSFLQSWNYPDSSMIGFDPSYDNFDIFISNKSRKSYGKGMRAISYSAVLLGLMEYCLEKEIPFSNLLILDSPLTTYHGKQTKSKDDYINEDIQDAFFENLSKLSKDCQLIVFDNKIPNNKVTSKINYEYFSKSNDGRYGFFPTK